MFLSSIWHYDINNRYGGSKITTSRKNKGRYLPAKIAQSAINVSFILYHYTFIDTWLLLKTLSKIRITVAFYLTLNTLKINWYHEQVTYNFRSCAVVTTTRSFYRFLTNHLLQEEGAVCYYQKRLFCWMYVCRCMRDCLMSDTAYIYQTVKKNDDDVNVSP